MQICVQKNGGDTQELYGFEISPAMISNITDKVIEVATDWQARPLQSVYPIVFFDTIRYNWIGESEGAKFYLKALPDANKISIS